MRRLWLMMRVLRAHPAVDVFQNILKTIVEVPNSGEVQDIFRHTSGQQLSLVLSLNDLQRSLVLEKWILAHEHIPSRRVSGQNHLGQGT